MQSEKRTIQGLSWLRKEAAGGQQREPVGTTETVCALLVVRFVVLCEAPVQCQRQGYTQPALVGASGGGRAGVGLRREGAPSRPRPQPEAGWLAPAGGRLLSRTLQAAQ